MRDLVYLVATTVDGFITDASGSNPDFLPFEGPQVPDLLAEFPEMIPTHVRPYVGLAPDTPNARFDTTIMGRATYDIGATQGIASPYPHLRQLVVSTTLGASPDPAVEVVDRDVVERVRALKVGRDDDAHYGAMTLEKQIDRVREHIAEALELGARALVGGLSSFKGRFVEPVVLVDVTPNMKVMREETFGPVLPIAKVASVEEAVRLANDSSFGLGSSVFARSGAEQVADRLRTGMTSINAVAAYAAIPGLPFGGVGESGFGRIHGDEGLLEFARVKATAYERFVLPGLGMAFSDPEKVLPQLRQLIKTLYGGSAVDDVTRVLRKLVGR